MAADRRASPLRPTSPSVAHEGRTVVAVELQGRKNVVVFFFPKAFTGTCERQVTGHAAGLREVQGAGRRGASASRPTRAAQPHAFAKQCGNVSFPLLSDNRFKTVMAYGVGRPRAALPNDRAGFVIDKQGVVALTSTSSRSRASGPARPASSRHSASCGAPGRRPGHSARSASRRCPPAGSRPRRARPACRLRAADRHHERAQRVDRAALAADHAPGVDRRDPRLDHDRAIALDHLDVQLLRVVDDPADDVLDELLER